MKSLAKTIVLLTVMAAPVVSIAQSNTALTPEQVRAELVQLEQAGYRPGDGDNTNYPADVQAAEARVSAQNGAVAQAPVADTGYGASTNGSSQAGVKTLNPTQDVYFGH